MDHLESGVQDQPGQHGETPSLLKIQKLAGCDGACLQSQLLGKLRQENGMNPGGGAFSQPRLRHCTPAWATEQDSVSKKVKIKIKINLIWKEGEEQKHAAFFSPPLVTLRPQSL